jgi:hypothetical protein
MARVTLEDRVDPIAKVGEHVGSGGLARLRDQRGRGEPGKLAAKGHDADHGKSVQ